MAAYSSFHNNLQNNSLGTFNPVAPIGGLNMQPTMPMSQFFLPQPVGNVYIMNTSSEIANIPAGTAMSVGLCINENVMYIKTLQNNNPVLVAYRMSPMEQLIEPINAQVAQGQPMAQRAPAQTENVVQAPVQSNEQKSQEIVNNALNKMNERLERIENTLLKSDQEQTKGGKVQWQV